MCAPHALINCERGRPGTEARGPLPSTFLFAWYGRRVRIHIYIVVHGSNLNLSCDKGVAITFHTVAVALTFSVN